MCVFTLHGLWLFLLNCMVSWRAEWIISRPLAYRAMELSFLVTIVTPFALRNFSSRETCSAVNGNVDWQFGVVFIWSKRLPIKDEFFVNYLPLGFYSSIAIT